MYFSLQILYFSFLAGSFHGFYVLFYAVEHPYNISLNSVSCKLLASISFSSPSGDFSCLFIWACFFDSLFRLPLWVCFYVLGRSAMASSLSRMAFRIRCPAGSSGAVSLITWDGCSRHVPCVSYVGTPFVIESWLPLAHLCLRLLLRLADCENQPQQWCVRCCAGAESMKWNSPQQPLFGHAAYEANWILLWCCLKLATVCVGSRAFWEGLWCRQMLDVAYHYPWATCLELLSIPQFVASSTVPGYVWKGASYSPRLAFTSSGTGSRSAIVPRHPEICFHLPLSVAAW